MTVQQVSAEQSSHKYVIFSLGEEQYGINISQVREIVRWARVTEIPQTSEHICGIRNLRGEVVPIVSLRSLFGLPRMPNDDDSKIIILEIGCSLFGAVVDSVDEVMEIASSAIQEPPASISGRLTSFVYGVAQATEGLVILISVEEIFANGEAEPTKGQDLK